MSTGPLPRRAAAAIPASPRKATATAARTSSGALRKSGVDPPRQGEDVALRQFAVVPDAGIERTLRKVRIRELVLRVQVVGEGGGRAEPRRLRDHHAGRPTGAATRLVRRDVDLELRAGTAERAE